jgi:hypothetical protein
MYTGFAIIWKKIFRVKSQDARYISMQNRKIQSISNQKNNGVSSN